MALIDDSRMQQALTRVKTELDERDNAIEEIQGAVSEMGDDVSNLLSAIESAPSEETGADLLAAELAETELLYGLLYKLTELPADETLADIRDGLVDEVEWLEVIRAEIEERITEVA